MSSEIARTGASAHLLVPPEALVQGREGAIPAQHLMPGDQVIGRDSGYITLRGVSRLRLMADLVEIDAGYLPGMTPQAPLRVSVEQGIWTRGRVVSTADLIAQGHAHAVGRCEVTQILLEFDHDDVVLAGGLALATARVALPLAA